MRRADRLFDIIQILRSSPGVVTAAMLAALKGKKVVIKELLAHKSEINHAGWNPLIYVAYGGYTDIVRLLVIHGADVNLVSENGTSALMMATREGHFATVLLLLEFRANVDQKNDSGATALGWALDTGNSDIAELLIKAGANE